SFRLQEVSKALTAGRKYTFWYMFEPLVMSKSVFDSLKPEHQKAMMEAGQSLEKFGMEEARKDDDRVVDVYGKAGAKVVDMDQATFLKWRKIAEQSAFKDFAGKVKDGKRLLDLALQVS
ncbi:MAG: C4-dicarboxylate ABC transporter, partial [Sulfurifustis sp.]